MQYFNGNWTNNHKVRKNTQAYCIKSFFFNIGVANVKGKDGSHTRTPLLSFRTLHSNKSCKPNFSEKRKAITQLLTLGNSCSVDIFVAPTILPSCLLDGPAASCDLKMPECTSRVVLFNANAHHMSLSLLSMSFRGLAWQYLRSALLLMLVWSHNGPEVIESPLPKHRH